MANPAMTRESHDNTTGSQERSDSASPNAVDAVQHQSEQGNKRTGPSKFYTLNLRIAPDDDSDEMICSQVKKILAILRVDRALSNKLPDAVRKLVTKDTKRKKYDDIKINPETGLPELAAVEKRTCAVCTMIKEVVAFLSTPMTASCDHELDACQKCVANHVRTSVEKGIVDSPCYRCKGTMEYWTVGGALPKAERGPFWLYDEMLKRRALSEMPDFRECQGCKNGWFDPCGNTREPLTCCPNCPRDPCKHCEKTCTFEKECLKNDNGIPLHERANPDPKQQASDEASIEKIKTSAKMCPGPMCGTWVTKLDGCDFVYCPNCKWQFCYECGVFRWKTNVEGRHAHAKGCSWRKYPYDPRFHSTALEPEDRSIIMCARYIKYPPRDSKIDGKIYLWDKKASDFEKADDNPDAVLERGGPARLDGKYTARAGLSGHRKRKRGAEKEQVA